VAAARGGEGIERGLDGGGLLAVSLLEWKNNLIGFESLVYVLV
jgi:hypothetical protein